MDFFNNSKMAIYWWFTGFYLLSARLFFARYKYNAKRFQAELKITTYTSFYMGERDCWCVLEPTNVIIFFFKTCQFYCNTLIYSPFKIRACWPLPKTGGVSTQMYWPLSNKKGVSTDANVSCCQLTRYKSTCANPSSGDSAAEAAVRLQAKSLRSEGASIQRRCSARADQISECSYRSIFWTLTSIFGLFCLHRSTTGTYTSTVILFGIVWIVDFRGKPRQSSMTVGVCVWLINGHLSTVANHLQHITPHCK